LVDLRCESLRVKILRSIVGVRVGSPIAANPRLKVGW